MDQIPSGSDQTGQAPASPAGLSLRQRLRHAWTHSLRFRLWVLGLMPLLIAFPIVIGVLVLIGGERADGLLKANIRSSLAGARSYLDQMKTDAGLRVDQLVKSERLIQLLRRGSSRAELDQMLSAAARGSGLDFLVIAGGDRKVIGSSSGVAAGVRLPESYVIRQALIGVANAAYERFEHDQLATFSPGFVEEARIDLVPRPANGEGVERRGLMINAAAHFPLTADDTDAILVGGILLNKNFAMIEHMREIIFPVGTLPDDAEGMTAVYLDDVRVAISRQKRQGLREIGSRAPAEGADAAIINGTAWLGRASFNGESYIAAYEPIADGDGRRIGMIGVGLPDAPYSRALWLVLAMIAGVLALTMLLISVLFLGAGRELTRRLARIGATMQQVRQGRRDARVGLQAGSDEVDQLTRDFDELLDTIERQDESRRIAQQTIADEASRRRAIFDHGRDGIIILNADGSVFEANPKGMAMLGYDSAAFGRLRISDWDARYTPTQLAAMFAGVGPEGLFFETVHRRRDGSIYPAEVSVSRAQWGDRTFWVVLQRDIAERKAVEAELEKYRINLEQLVAARTRELNNRTAQLDAIFNLSPDGFVSFDAAARVSYANPSFLRMTGMQLDEIIELDDVAFSGQLARRCLASAAFPGLGALRAALKKADGGEVRGARDVPRRQLIELSGPGNRVLEVSLRMSESENVSQILYFRDVTHETEVDRMKSEFLATAAHELRTPMASVYGYSELLLEQEFDTDMRRELLSTIFKQSGLMASIINELLDLARIEARRGKDFVVERVPLQEMVREAVAGYKVPSGRNPPRVIEAAAPLIVNVDRKKMQQALLNILSNAYKYSQAGTEVELAFREEQGEEQGEGRGRVGIAVRDHGMGMTAEQLARVCERFYRADASGQIPGTGLGMSIVKEITELHGGEVQLASEPGAGTQVTLWIPAATN